ncbi:hypothetical protein [Leucobacter luti]|uniref:Uncharacterized protein n=1 Tax=Leucobacter luti TaxID=340320 RepID=A0A4Q7U053_9MICO|nr:hypothetical protein [Leucobacter luti]MBL3698869.1 hypothetical protein [Leucobacter luti]RZT66247.1 hypothetical protein EV139_1678 [Leucobacter luti]
MTENPEISEEARKAAREKYGVVPDPTRKNRSLSKLGWISPIGFTLTLIAIVMVTTTDSIVTATIWGGLITASATAGFLSLIVYLAAKAIITSRDQ